MATQADADFFNEPRFNRIFEYTPPGSTSGPFKVKYADYGYRNEAHPEQERIMLFSGPLMGSRLVLATKDALAIKHKIRIISADRPGMGGTDPVAPKDRLTIWRGTFSVTPENPNNRHHHPLLTTPT
jgi:pimeloyl-ACP methyl ester carboxylesterase